MGLHNLTASPPPSRPPSSINALDGDDLQSSPRKADALIKGYESDVETDDGDEDEQGLSDGSDARNTSSSWSLFPQRRMQSFKSISHCENGPGVSKYKGTRHASSGINSTPPPRSASRVDVESSFSSSSSDSDQRANEFKRNTLLRTPIHVFVQIEVTTFIEDEITLHNGVSMDGHCLANFESAHSHSNSTIIGTPFIDKIHSLLA